MNELGLASTIVDSRAYEHAIARFRANRIVMPTFAQLADPLAQPERAAGDPRRRGP